MSEVNKKLESEYQYQYKTPQQIGAEGEITGPLVPIKGGFPVISDQLVPSTITQPKPIKTPPIDAPELPIPTKKAIRTAAVKKAINEQAKINPWIANPSYLGAFLIKMYELQKLFSTTRYTESQMKQIIERSMFELGKDNADMAKKLKELAASKEFTQAVGSFINAGVSLYQVGTLMKSRGEAEREANGSQKYGSEMQNKQEAKIQQLETEKTNLSTQKQQAEQNAQPQQTEQFENQINKTEAKIAKEKKALQEMKDEHRKEVRENIHRLDQIAQAKAETLKQATNGVVQVVAGLFTIQEGATEKIRALNEALLQVFNKMDDGVNKAKDDLQTQIDRILQQAAQTSSETIKAHQVQSSRG